MRSPTERPASSAANVVVGVDGSAAGRSAAEYGVQEALRRASGLRLVHAFGWQVLPPPYTPYDEPDHGPRAAALDLLAELAHEIRADHPHLPVTTRMIDGSPGAVLVDATREAQLLVGSAAAQAAAHARCPVVVVRGETPADGAPIMLGTDGSPGANRAAEVAFAEAQRRDAELILVHHQSTRTGPAGSPRFWATVGDPDAGAYGVGARYPDVKYRTEIVTGDSAAAALIALASRTGAGLLVVGSRGRGGFRGLVMGSTSRSLIEHAPCPVMVVPPVHEAE